MCPACFNSPYGFEQQVADEEVLDLLIRFAVHDETVVECENQSNNGLQPVSLIADPYLKNYITSRIDIKNVGSDTNDIEFVHVSDPTAEIDRPRWFCQKSGIGYVVYSRSGEIRLRLRCRGSGDLSVLLRGCDVRNRAGKRIPFWIDYKAFEVNGKPQLDAVCPACHDRPYRFSQQVQDGDFLDLFIQFGVHDEQKRPTTRRSGLRSILKKLISA